MNSMNYIGRIVSNFREFYNEINAATLTGAIDVVVVEQADGTFTCSPFHVRFGKLGVLRSREKVVDIEINGETQDIHMKLGDSGEAFFVEEVLSSDSEHIPEHLATSPIPISEFEKLYAPEDKPRRKSIDLGYNNDDVSPVLENQVNDYSKRRYTDSHNQDYSLKKREFVTRQLGLGNIELGEHSNEDLSLSRADSLSVNKQSDEECNPDSELSETIFKMDSLEAEQTPKETPLVEELPKLENVSVIPKVEEPEKSESENKSGNKKRRRKKSMIKKKNSQRKTSTVSEPKDLDVPEETDSKMCESITDKDSLGSSQSEHDLISGSDSTMNSRVVGRDPDFLFFSDTELTANSERNTRPNTPVQSDTEFEVSQRKESEQPAGQSWAWGQLPNAPESLVVSMHEDIAAGAAEAKQAERNSMLSSMFSFMKQNKRMRHSGSPEGMYLADLSSGTLDPEVAALYFPNSTRNIERHNTSDPDNDNESGNGPSLPQSPSSVEGAKSIDSDYEDHKNDRYLQDISLSLCGWTDHPNEDIFIRHVVSFTDLCNNPSILESPDLVVRIKDKYYSWRAATPIIISMLVYQRQLPQSTVEQLLSMHMPSSISIQDKSQKIERPAAYSWWNWRRKGGDRSVSTSTDIPETVVTIPDINNLNIGENNKQEQELSQSQSHSQRITPIDELSIKDEISTKTIETTTYSDAVTAENTSFIPDMLESQELDDSDASKKDMPSEMIMTQSMYGEKFRKTLRLSSDQIKKLNLNEGMNEVEFSVTTAYQGTTRCKCHIYRWRYDDKIVISDIDGTITKSDVLGHILPIVGKDWAQSGVAQLFTKIMNNGYKLLYLSARAIGQARVTREYLRSIKQGNLSLPDGPLLLNPTSLISAFHREVIEKKPEQFKISCLSDIQALFPPESNPFYAGYGNRINDVWAYRAVGIPIMRIFTINHKGELKHELTQTFQSSYSNMTSFVDQMFPPLLEAANDYSQFVYWRQPIAMVDEEIALPVVTAK